jgi:hypothetical protein
MHNKDQNILDAFLELLKVKHIKTFTGTLFNEHPHKYNLFGLSKMLSQKDILTERFLRRFLFDN